VPSAVGALTFRDRSWRRPWVARKVVDSVKLPGSWRSRLSDDCRL
jgi:hypothetical protein